MDDIFDDDEFDGRRCVTHFIEDLDSLIDRYRAEYNITYAEVIGAMECLKFNLLREAHSKNDDDDSED